MQKLLAIALTTMALAGCGGGGDSGTTPATSAGSPPASPAPISKDKQAFLDARKAATAQTWEAAILMLNRINVNTIDDVELLEFVDFSRRCATVAQKLGIDRKSDPSDPYKIVTEANWGKVIATLAEMTAKLQVADVATLVGDATTINTQIPRYYELDRILSARYGQ